MDDYGAMSIYRAPLCNPGRSGNFDEGQAGE